MSSQAQPLEKEDGCLKLQMSKVSKARDGTFGFAAEQSRQVRLLEARIGLLQDELDSLNQKKLTSCDMNAVSQKVADAKET